LFTPDFSVPMRNSLLWVYEGQTQYWGYVLGARSGIVSKEDTLSAYAMIAALHEKRPGRQWRPLVDTTNDPIMSARRPQPWLSWQRSEDYYNEGLLIWLDADMKIRELTGGRKSLDDFARAFFGPGDRDWGVSTYDLDTVAKTLNGVAPYDWGGFLKTRVYDIAKAAPLDWIAKGGYRLVYSAEPTAYWTSEETARKIVDLSYSLGLVVSTDGDSKAQVNQVIWDSPAFAAGITAGSTIVAVNGDAYDADTLRTAVRGATTSGKPIGLIVKKGDRYVVASIPYKGGLLYPRLEKVAKGEAGLDRLLTARK
ncbi:MAG: peptidase M61, partial [Rhizorhabdus sp.]